MKPPAPRNMHRAHSSTMADDSNLTMHGCWDTHFWISALRILYCRINSVYMLYHFYFFHYRELRATVWLIITKNYTQDIVTTKLSIRSKTYTYTNYKQNLILRRYLHEATQTSDCRLPSEYLEYPTTNQETPLLFVRCRALCNKHCLHGFFRRFATNCWHSGSFLWCDRFIFVWTSKSTRTSTSIRLWFTFLTTYIITFLDSLQNSSLALGEGPARYNNDYLYSSYDARWHRANWAWFTRTCSQLKKGVGKMIGFTLFLRQSCFTRVLL